MVIAAILLAAHDASIDDVPLALLPWGDDQTLIEYHVAQLQAAGANVIEVVLGYDAERIIPLVARDNVEPIVNARWQDDAASALRVGATAVPRETTAAIVARVDEPRAAYVYRQLLDERLRSGSAITRVGGAASTPIVVNPAVLAELRNTSNDAGGLDAILARHAHETATVGSDDDGALPHIKDASSLAEAREQLH